jgi:hypothetical protein
MTTLFRPVGLYELSLLWDSGFREFPPRLAHQPFFYPVASADYARHIAANWNVNDKASGFSGFVTRFAVSHDYLSGFEPHRVGAGTHIEYWIPAGQLPSFNRAIADAIVVQDAFFGPEFVGYVPQKYGLAGRDAIGQFVILAKSWAHSPMDFACEVSANRKSVYLNSWFWAQHDFANFGIDSRQKRDIINRLGQAWELNHIKIPFPLALRESACRTTGDNSPSPKTAAE